MLGRADRTAVSLGTLFQEVGVHTAELQHASAYVNVGDAVLLREGPQTALFA